MAHVALETQEKTTDAGTRLVRIPCACGWRGCWYAEPAHARHSLARHQQQPHPLDPDRLYLGDNGRVTCGALGCAGMTAYATGRDLSGQPLMLLDPATARARGFTCETCRREPAAEG